MQLNAKITKAGLTPTLAFVLFKCVIIISRCWHNWFYLGDSL